MVTAVSIDMRGDLTWTGSAANERVMVSHHSNGRRCN